jgi:hypothetical protein
VESGEPVKVNFHPSCLLTIGDCLAFSRELSAAQPWDVDGGSAAATGALAATPGRPLLRVPSAARLTLTPPLPPAEGAALPRQPSTQLPRQLRSRAGATTSGTPPPQAPQPQLPLHRSRSLGALSFAPDGGGRGGFPAPRGAQLDPALPDEAGGGEAGALGALASVQQSVALREAPPSMQEQMALGSCITSRVPQRWVGGQRRGGGCGTAVRACDRRSLQQAPGTALEPPLPQSTAASAACTRPLPSHRALPQVPHPEPDRQ